MDRLTPEISQMFEHVQPVIGSYANRPAVCLDYDRRAAEVARLLAALVGEHLPQVCVEHVGSTSVPGCAGKGIVPLYDLGDLRGIRRPNVAMGLPETAAWSIIPLWDSRCRRFAGQF